MVSFPEIVCVIICIQHAASILSACWEVILEDDEAEGSKETTLWNTLASYFWFLFHCLFSCIITFLVYLSLYPAEIVIICKNQNISQGQKISKTQTVCLLCVATQHSHIRGLLYSPSTTQWEKVTFFTPFSRRGKVMALIWGYQRNWAFYTYYSVNHTLYSGAFF